MKIFGIVGWKNSGKTTLVERLVTCLTDQGFSVSTVKHAHHEFDIDQPGKDSHRHRSAGAGEVLLTSSQRWVLMHELRGAAEPDLAGLLTKLAPVDLVLVEGFKACAHPKIEVRSGVDSQGSLATHDANIVAIASDGPAKTAKLPLFDRNDITGIAAFILAQTGLRAK